MDSRPIIFYQSQYFCEQSLQYSYFSLELKSHYENPPIQLYPALESRSLILFIACSNYQIRQFKLNLQFSHLVLLRIIKISNPPAYERALTPTVHRLLANSSVRLGPAVGFLTVSRVTSNSIYPVGCSPLGRWREGGESVCRSRDAIGRGCWRVGQRGALTFFKTRGLNSPAAPGVVGHRNPPMILETGCCSTRDRRVTYIPATPYA